MDRDSKLVLSYLVGKRTGIDGHHFMRDVAQRVTGRPQVFTDSLNAYTQAVYSAFNGNVDHATVQKTYASVQTEPGRYSPPVCTGCTKHRASGKPDVERATTSHIERQNLTVRMQSRRFTRLTNGFSKRLENHVAALDLHYWWFNFGRKHATLKTTPAVAAGIADRALTMLDLVRMIEAEELAQGGRITDYLPAPKRDEASK